MECLCWGRRCTPPPSVGLGISTDSGAEVSVLPPPKVSGSNNVNGVFAVNGSTNCTPPRWVVTSRQMVGPVLAPTEGLGSNAVNGVFAVGVDGVRRHRWRLKHLDRWRDQRFHQPHHRRLIGSNNVPDCLRVGVDGVRRHRWRVDISTDGGTSFTNRTTTPGPRRQCRERCSLSGRRCTPPPLAGGWASRQMAGPVSPTAPPPKVSAATPCEGGTRRGRRCTPPTNIGLSISTNGGTSFTNRTTTEVSGNNSVRGVRHSWCRRHPEASSCPPGLCAVTC